MKSLRTDDILGAKPRVRHMPLNLLRERNVPTAFLMNMQAINPEQHTQNYYKNYQPYEYANHEHKNLSIYSHLVKNKEARHINYDSLKNNMTTDQISKSRHQIPIRESIQVQKNYQEKERQRVQNQINRPKSISKNELQRTNEDLKSSRRSEVQSRRSMDSKDFKSDEGKKIFRGLGFNIITNHKFEYTFQHKATPQTRF